MEKYTWKSKSEKEVLEVEEVIRNIADTATGYTSIKQKHILENTLSKFEKEKC